jgi:hypothetical protein
MNDQALGVADVCQMREQLQRLDELLGGRKAAFDAKSQDGVIFALQILLGQGVAGMLLQSG